MAAGEYVGNRVTVAPSLAVYSKSIGSGPLARLTYSSRSATRMMAATPIDEEFRSGWPVVLACFATAVFAWGFVSYGQPVYLAELQRMHGWSAGTIGGATTVSFIIGAALLPWVSGVIQRLGACVVLSGGAILLGAGAIGLSHAAEPWQLYPCNLVMGFGWAGMSSTAISTILAHWFDLHRGLALSLALTGASVGGFAVAPVPLTSEPAPRLGRCRARGRAEPVGGDCAIDLDRHPVAGRPTAAVGGSHSRAQGARDHRPQRGVAGCAVLVGRCAIRAGTISAGRYDRISGELSPAITRHEWNVDCASLHERCGNSGSARVGSSD